MAHYQFYWDKVFHYNITIHAKNKLEAFKMMKKIIDTPTEWNDYLDDDELTSLVYEGNYDSNGTNWTKATRKDDDQFFQEIYD